MKKITIFMSAILILFFFVAGGVGKVEAASSPKPIYTGKVTAYSMNVRAWPSPKSKPIGVVKKNQVLEVYSVHTYQKSKWYKVKYKTSYGFVSGQYLSLSKYVAPKPATKTTPVVTGKPIYTGVITTGSLNVRTSPNPSSKAIGQVVKNQKVDVYSTHMYGSTKWYKIKFKTTYGYVSGKYVKVSKYIAPAPKPVVKTQPTTPTTTTTVTKPTVTTPPPAPTPAKLPLSGEIIVVDAGHGGTDPGASGNGAVEKSIVLDTAKRLASKLKSQGATVYESRPTDVFQTLESRVAFAKTKKADIFISIHANAAGTESAKGIETWYNTSKNPQGSESKELAQDIQNRLMQVATSTTNRGAKNGEFYVIKNTTMPSVLVELGFVSNKVEASQLNDASYRDKLANGIMLGVLDFYK